MEIGDGNGWAFCTWPDEAPPSPPPQPSETPTPPAATPPAADPLAADPLAADPLAADPLAAGPAEVGNGAVRPGPPAPGGELANVATRPRGGGTPHRHWGRHGAAGLVLLRRRVHLEVLLQLRAEWTHQGGLWGLPGGARDSHETVADAAKREANEEADIPVDAVDVLGTWVGTDHRVWTYTYVIARVIGDVEPRVTTPESDALAWVDLDRVPDLPLHPYLLATWQELRARIDAALATAPGEVTGQVSEAQE